MADGLVFDIQHFCLDDGPGIRTTVFFKGCPLRCIWCHNAEGLSAKPELYYASEKCAGCGKCADVCPENVHSFRETGHDVDFPSCVNCGTCADVCGMEALRIAGRRMSVWEVLKDVLADKPFYDQSEGGVTLSGGEPLMQGDFACELAELAKENGLHVCVETSGYCSTETLRRILPSVDLFLFDFKHYDPEQHRRFTGVDNRRILENLRFLSENGKELILRCPIIPGCNASEPHYRAIAELSEELCGVTAVHIEPYHPFGLSKYRAVGREAAYVRDELLDRRDAERIRDHIASLTSKPVGIS